MNFDTLVYDPPTEPIHIVPAAFTRTVRPAPAILWIRAHGVYMGLAIGIALTWALTPLPRFETALAAITTINGALWALHRIGGRR